MVNYALDYMLLPAAAEYIAVGQLWKYAWLICGELLVQAAARSNSILPSIPMLQNLLYNSWRLAGSMEAAVLHNRVTSLIQEPEESNNQSSSTAVLGSHSHTPQLAPQADMDGLHSTWGTAVASGHPIIQPNSDTIANAPLAPAVYLRLCTLFQLPQLSALSL